MTKPSIEEMEKFRLSRMEVPLESLQILIESWKIIHEEMKSFRLTPTNQSNMYETPSGKSVLIPHSWKPLIAHMPERFYEVIRSSPELQLEKMDELLDTPRMKDVRTSKNIGI